MEGGTEDDKKKMTPQTQEVENKSKRKMKTASQLEILEKTYAVETYPSETLRAELSVKLGLSDRQLQMWFCHRRLKDRKPPSTKRQRKDSPASAAAPALTATPSVGGEDMLVGVEVGVEHGSGSGSGSSPFGHAVDSRRVLPVAVGRMGADLSSSVKRYYEPPQSITELRAIAFVEAQLGEPLREDGPILGMEFDPLPPDAFGAPLGAVGQQKQTGRPYEAKLYERPDAKSTKGAARALHEYQFLPEQPTVRTDPYERVTSSHYYGSPTDGLSARTPSLSTGRPFVPGNELVPIGYGFQGQIPSSNLLPHQGRQGNLVASASAEYDNIPRKNSFADVGMDAQLSPHPISALDNVLSSEKKASLEEDALRIERKRKSEEARIAKEVEAHEKKIRKELEKQDILRRKREEQMKKEMERHDRERRKEEERLLREKQREEERYQREQRRELERREKFLQKESIRAEKMRQKEELRREKEAARLKAANDRAIARKIAKESMELIDDERLELMELAASSKGLPSMLSLDYETLQNLDLFRDMLTVFPPKSVRLKKPFAIQPWTDSEENIGNLLMVWRFLITFADILGLWPFTLDEFVQAFHDYDPRLLGEIHIVLLRSIIKDIEDVARTPSTGLGANQNSAANPGGGHPQIVEGAYSWGFDIRSWQRHLNPLTWPEVLRQFAISAGFGPKLKKRSIEPAYLRDDNEGNDGKDVISNLRNGVAAVNALAIMQERGYSNPRRSRHRLTPGTVKFAAFHVLSLEGSKGLTILEVAEKIQKSGLRDLTTSKTPEASIAAALSRDGSLFEKTAPSTYCVRPAYRKDPADSEAILAAAREKIQIFKSGFPDVEDAEDVERDEDSESDVAEDPEVDDLGNESSIKKEAHDSLEADRLSSKSNLGIGKLTFSDEVTRTPQGGLLGVGEVLSSVHSEGFNEVKGPGAFIDQSIGVAGGSNQATSIDQEETDIDDCNSGEPWVQGLMEGEYSGLSVEERLDALVALIGIAIEGNSIRIVLEERLESANALKKQMWAEAQLDKRRSKEEYVTKMQFPSFTGIKPEPNLAIFTAEGKQSPMLAADCKNNPDVKQEPASDSMNDNNYLNNLASEGNLPMQDFSAGPDNLQLQPPGFAAEKSRSQLKSYIGHKAEEMYVYRSLPLGQDRRRNRYWQFITSASRNDPGLGRIFVEFRQGGWRLIDSEEDFDALVASFDVRGMRESNLHSMLQMIEIPFKETVRRNLLRGRQVGDNVKTEAAEMDSPSSSVYNSNLDASEPSSSFVVELGKTAVEKSNALKRYHDLQRWMWKECLNSSTLCAFKFGKKRCMQLLGICDNCHDSYFFEEKQCQSCGSLDTNANFSEHVSQFEQKLKADPDWFSSSDSVSYPLRIRLLKVQLALVEVSVPPEAIQPVWTEGYRKSWGLKLHTSSSAEDLFKMLTMLERVIKRDYLSPNFETTNELLASCTSSTESSGMETISVLPWIPQTTAAVALRLMDLDSSIYYMLQQKVESQKDKGTGNFIKLPSKYAVVKNIQGEELLEPLQEMELLQENWISPGSGLTSSGRGRGRGRGRGGRPRGGRSQRTVGKRSIAINSENFGWKGGRSRGRGGRRRGGRRTIKTNANTKPKPGKRPVEIVSQREILPDESVFSKPPGFDRDEWNVEDDDDNMRMQVDHDAENATSSESSEEFDSDNGEYDDAMAVNDYDRHPGVYNGKSDEMMVGSDDNFDVEEDEVDDDDDDEDVEEDDDDEQGELDVGRYINGYSDEEGNNDGRNEMGMLDDVTESSSDYSD